MLGNLPTGKGAGAFPSAPQMPGSPGGFMGSPIMQRLMNGAPQDIPGFSMQNPGMLDYMKQQAQWLTDNAKGGNLFGSLSAMGQPPQIQPQQTAPGAQGPNLNDILMQLRNRRV